MRGHWERIHRGLNNTIRLPRMVRLYVEMARYRSPLAPFQTPHLLVEHLDRVRTDPIANDVYRSMVDAWRRGPICYSEVAGQILWLGLWPLLNRLYWAQLGYWRDQENDLASEIGRCLTIVLRGTDLTRVDRVALTLIRNTQRDLIERRQAQLFGDDQDWSSLQLPWQSFMDASPNEAPARIVDVAGALKQCLGPDFDLAVAAYDSRCDYEQLTRQFGLEEEEIRRRIRRAWRRVRRQMKRNRIE